MTNEEAIEVLAQDLPCETDEDLVEAMAMAIVALEQTPKTWGLDDAREDFMSDVYNTLDFLPTNNEANRIIDSFDRVTSGLEQQPCEDAISRKDMLAVLRQSHSLTQAWDGFEKLPSVTPKEKTGKWTKTQSGDDMFPEIIVCSKCNNENSHLDFNEHAEPIGKVFIKSKYCPNCGARMQEVEENG